MTVSKLTIAVAIQSFAVFVAAGFRALSDGVFCLTSESPLTGDDIFEIADPISTGNGIGIAKLSDSGLSGTIRTALEGDATVVEITATKTGGNRWVFMAGENNVAAAAYNSETRTSLSGWGELTELLLQGKISALADCTAIVVDQSNQKAYGIKAASTKPQDFPDVTIGEIMQLEGFTREGIGWGEEA